MPTMQQPELYIGNITNLADGNGQITNEDTKKFLADSAKQFVAFTQKF
jgi:chromate reductase